MLSQVWYNFPENFPCSNFSRVKINPPCVYRRHHRGAPTRFESRARYVAEFSTSAATLSTRGPFSCAALVCCASMSSLCRQFVCLFVCSMNLFVCSLLLLVEGRVHC